MTDIEKLELDAYKQTIGMFAYAIYSLILHRHPNEGIFVNEESEKIIKEILISNKLIFNCPRHLSLSCCGMMEKVCTDSLCLENPKFQLQKWAAAHDFYFTNDGGATKSGFCSKNHTEKELM
jgi:hypothetical protein